MKVEVVNCASSCLWCICIFRCCSII